MEVLTLLTLVLILSLNPKQEESLQLQEQLGRQAATGTGIYNNRAAQQADLQNLMGSSLGQASGAQALGSARSQRAMQGALADRSLDFAKERQHQRLDAPHTSAQRYFGYLSGAPQQQRQETSGGGGK